MKKPAVNNAMTRRDALKSLAVAAGAIGLPAVEIAQRAEAADGQHVALNDPLAVGLGYVEDASKVSAAKFPTFKPNQKCANCVLVKGHDGEEWRPCNLFQLKLVHANGWCRSWTAKA